MSLKHRMRVLFLGATLSAAAMMGVPMRAEEIEELMAAANRPVAAHVLRDEEDKDDKK